MDNTFLIFKSLFDIWKDRNYDLYFYFQEIFPKALDTIEKGTEKELLLSDTGEPKYKAFFIPVGLSIENVAIISTLLKPTYLRLAYTEITKRFHMRHIQLVKENIKKVCDNIDITETVVTSDDQKTMENKIIDWIQEMKSRYGLSYDQMAIDVTGGTKPMSIGAHNASLSFDEIDAFYLQVEYDEDTQAAIPGTERLIKLRKDKAQVDDKFIFVVMPFKERFNEIYQRGIKEAIEGIGLKCLRVDEEIFIGGIMDKIRENLIRAKIIVAELTEHNLNVYYELGLAHGYGKKVIMLTQDSSVLPSDLKHLRMIIYNPANLDDLKERLVKKIEYVKKL
jgi:hypothetical protein